MIVRLREWRERRGYSVRGLADRAGVSFSTVHQAEVGRLSPTLDMLAKLSRALIVRVVDLIPTDEPKRRLRRRKP